MVRRSRLEIYFDILNIISKGVDKPTKIMYRTNLSWNTLQDCLSALTEKGFIKEEVIKKSTRYYITNKGRSALSYHRKSLEGLDIARVDI